MIHPNVDTCSLAGAKSTIILLAILCLPSIPCSAEDWPMWRHDAGRTAATAESLPKNLSLRWTRQLPKIEPAFHSPRLQFDAGYEPIIADGRLLIASSRHDSITAYDAETGKELWSFISNGPVRFAPAVWKDSVCFGSDDGSVYCLELSTGNLRWKHKAVPKDRLLLGNRRLISVWPVRGGPVVADGIVYFAAGVWPFEGVFVYAMNISNGAVIWRNERLGYLFGQQPHNTQAIGGLAPQGYLVVNGDELVVPCSTAYPARLDRRTGKLIEFALPSPGRLPGGWFAALDAETSRAIRRGKLTFDDMVNQQLHEDKVNKGPGDTGISRMISTSDRTLNFDDALDDMGLSVGSNKVHSMIVSNQQLIITTLSGQILCFGKRNDETPQSTVKFRDTKTELSATQQAITEARALIKAAKTPHGVAIVAGLHDGSLVKALVKESDFQVIVFDDSAARVTALRSELQAAGVYGERASVIERDFRRMELPPYLATVITMESAESRGKPPEQLLQALRPFGGIAALGTMTENEYLTNTELESMSPGNFEHVTSNGSTLIRRTGPLPGTADYRGNYAHCEDSLVRFPLGVLWFDDTLAHFKRSPQPQFFDGVMVSRPKDWHAERIKGQYTVDYPLLPPVLSDIYTGRVLAESEQKSLRQSLPKVGLATAQQSYYHAPHQKTALHPDPPLAGERINPLTGMKEPRAFPKTYGCDGGVDYGQFYTLRSGTAAFYDKTLESGTVFISGPRSGCTNSIIPSGGLLNVPYFYEGCTCSYPLPTALSLVAMSEDHEQWSSWGNDDVTSGSIKRIGLNFGAPGDRKTREGTLWLDYPSVGGPSPKIRVDTSPANPTCLYRHSHWMKKGDGWPWVAASAVEGLEKLTLHDLQPGEYTVRLYFAELAEVESGDRVQEVSVDGDTTNVHSIDIIAATKDPMKGMVHQIDNVTIADSLEMTLKATSGKTLLSGIELIKSE